MGKSEWGNSTGVGELDTIPPEVAAHLPAQIRGMIEAGCSWEAALTLMTRCGGLQVRIPPNPRPGHIVVDRCGIDVARELSRSASGLSLNVPFGYAARRAARNLAIRKEYDAGIGIVDLVTKYGITTWSIRKILAE